MVLMVIDVEHQVVNTSIVFVMLLFLAGISQSESINENANFFAVTRGISIGNVRIVVFSRIKPGRSHSV